MLRRARRYKGSMEYHREIYLEKLRNDGVKIRLKPTRFIDNVYLDRYVIDDVEIQIHQPSNKYGLFKAKFYNNKAKLRFKHKMIIRHLLKRVYNHKSIDRVTHLREESE